MDTTISALTAALIVFVYVALVYAGLLTDWRHVRARWYCFRHGHNMVIWFEHGRMDERCADCEHQSPGIAIPRGTVVRFEQPSIRAQARRAVAAHRLKKQPVKPFGIGPREVM